MYIRKFNESFRKINTDDVYDFLVELEDIGFKYYIDQFEGYLDINISINADFDYDKGDVFFPKFIEMSRNRYSAFGAIFFKFEEVKSTILSIISLLKEKGVEFKSLEIRNYSEEKSLRDIEFENVDDVDDDEYGCAIYLNFKYK
jgi:hypothetical protein